MRFAIVGCGYVADLYVSTLRNHPNLELAGIFDCNLARAQRFAEFHHLRRYESLDQLLEDGTVHLVANLTNPRSHFAISQAALQAGKHVYSEKPLAMSLSQAEQLVELADGQGLLLASAPCSVLSETAQTLWKALREGQIGTPRLIYAELDDGPIPFMNYREWASESGAPWPFQDEFEVGCTLEHAGYYLGWLTAFFGPAKRITSFASIVLKDKRVPIEVHSPDLAVACIEFASGPIARLTCSIYAPHDHQMRIVGDAGVLSTGECWDYGSPVHLSPRTPLALWHPRRARMLGRGPRRLPLLRPARFRSAKRAYRMDVCRGIADLAEAVTEGRAPRLSARWSLHVNELVLAMQNGCGRPYESRTSFEPMAPMPWAQ